MAVNPARVWRSYLEPTIKEVFDMPKGDKGTAAQLWGDVFMTNEVLHDKMRKDGNEHYLTCSRWPTTGPTTRRKKSTSSESTPRNQRPRNPLPRRSEFVLNKD